MTRTALPSGSVNAEQHKQTGPSPAASLPGWVAERAVRAPPAPRPTLTDEATADANQTQTFFTVAEVAGVLRVSTRTVRMLVGRGEIACVRVGRRVRISASAMEAFCCQQHSDKACSHDTS